MENIRNFSIIAHIDHGKSTLSDRLIQVCGGFTNYKVKNQILDSMDLERERGITIKAKNVTLCYKAKNNKSYQINFIDTPGHVDFSYEVFRALTACEGALLVIDATQGIEAQTLSNYYKAIEMGLVIVPVLNKIDLPTANTKNVMAEIKDIIGIDNCDIVQCSAKTGVGIIDLLERLICDIPPPKGNPNALLRSLIIDSWFDNYLGVVSLVRIKDGCIHKGDKIKVMNTNCVYNVMRLGIFTPKSVDYDELKCGAIGWLVCSIKNVLDVPVGATLTISKNQSNEVIPMLKRLKPQIYASLFPVNPKDYKSFRNSLDKLKLNDDSLVYEQESSSIFGVGFRCGFSGLLHMEIVQERLEREYKLNLVATVPTVIYEIHTTNKKVIYISNPFKLPSKNNIKEIREPIVECRILLPQKYINDVITLCLKKRGIQIEMIYHNKDVTLVYDIPMSEVIINFSKNLQSISHGYASLSYEFKYFRIANLVCMDVLINKKKIDYLSLIIHHKNVLYRSKKLIEKIKELIPRQQFDIVIQTVIGNRIISSTTIKSMRKNVTEKCYGGDVTRKKKLIQNQKEGKKRMQKVGKVKIPKCLFLTNFYLDKN